MTQEEYFKQRRDWQLEVPDAPDHEARYATVFNATLATAITIAFNWAMASKMRVRITR